MTVTEDVRRGATLIDIEITDELGLTLDARVEIGAASIVVHSRSGAGTRSRNPDYRKALEVIFDRFAAEYLTPETFLDSQPARRDALSIDERRLIGPDEFFVDGKEFATAAINRSNQGSKSKGAWRRLLLRVPAMPDYALRSIVDGTVRSRAGRQMSMALLRRVEKRHLDAAVAELRGETARFNRFENPTGWLLIPEDGGEPLPPKRVFGIALAEALRTHTTPNDFASGKQVFDIMREHGFSVLPLSDVPQRTQGKANRPEALIPSIPPTEEEKTWIEGHPRVAAHLVRERSGAMPMAFKADFRVRHGKLFCERCRRDHVEDYGEEIAEACFEVHHTVPVAQMRAGHATTFEQLQLLCSNCHRATHREMARAKP